MSRPELDHVLDRLYAAPLRDFVALRNEAAKELRKAGDREAADEVKALRKPSAAAWAVNRLHFQGDGRLEELADATAAVVQAHGEAGADLQAAVQERRRCVDRLVEAARDALQEAGHGTTREQMRRVAGTIEAATAAGSEHRPGRLTTDLEAPGFGVLSGLSLAAPAGGGRAAPRPRRSPKARAKGRSRPTGKAAPRGAPKAPSTRPAGRTKQASTTPDEDHDRRLKALQTELQAEEKRKERARREVTRAETAHLAAMKRIERAQAGIEDLEERLARARTALEEARSEAEDRARELEEAEAAGLRADERVRQARERIDSALRSS